MRASHEAQARLRAVQDGHRAALTTYGITFHKPVLAILRDGDHLPLHEVMLAERVTHWIHMERHHRGPMTVREVVTFCLRQRVPRASIAMALLRARAVRHHDIFWNPLPGPRLAHDLGFGLITKAGSAAMRPARAARGLLREGESF
jgi:hypothetical protein